MEESNKFGRMVARGDDERFVFGKRTVYFVFPAAVDRMWSNTRWDGSKK
jgi:hypothetical protein